MTLISVLEKLKQEDLKLAASLQDGSGRNTVKNYTCLGRQEWRRRKTCYENSCQIRVVFGVFDLSIGKKGTRPKCWDNNKMKPTWLLSGQTRRKKGKRERNERGNAERRRRCSSRNWQRRGGGRWAMSLFLSFPACPDFVTHGFVCEGRVELALWVIVSHTCSQY